MSQQSVSSPSAALHCFTNLARQSSVIIPTILRLQYLSRQVHSADPTLLAAETVIWTSVQLHLSIVACLCYCFKSFVVAVSTNHGGIAINVHAYDSNNGLSGRRRWASTSARATAETKSEQGLPVEARDRALRVMVERVDGLSRPW